MCCWQVHQAVKPSVLSCMGDIALSIGDKFEPYLTHVLQTITAAEALSVSRMQLGMPLLRLM